MSIATRTVVLVVPSAHCATCRLRILEALALEGVVQAEVDLRTREATVLLDPERTSETAVVSALTAAGHPPHAEATAAQQLPNPSGASSGHSNDGDDRAEKR